MFQRHYLHPLLACCLVIVARGMGGMTERAAAEDPAPRAIVINGDFEDRAADDAKCPARWYYLQQGTLLDANDAPSGQRFLRFSNATPGRTAQAQQHVRLDGREVRSIDVAVSVALHAVSPGQALAERPSVRIHFYDADDADLGQETLGPWAGTMAWSRETSRLAVPERTRLILIEVGLAGATGTADFDDLQIVAAPHNPTVLPKRIGK